MDIRNNGSRKVTIESWANHSFARIEIPRSIEKDGVMHMQPVDHFSVMPGKSVHLKPGGFHLMMNPQHELVPGDEVIVTLLLDDQTSQSIIMIVRK